MGKKSDRRLDGPAGSGYAKAIRDWFCLQSWTLHVQDCKPEDRHDPGLEANGEVVASIEPMETRHVATLRLYPAYWKSDPSGQRHAMTHEMVHVLFAELRSAVNSFEHACDELSWRHLFRAYRMAEERTIDDVAGHLAPFLPLPATEPTAAKE